MSDQDAGYIQFGIIPDEESMYMQFVAELAGVNPKRSQDIYAFIKSILDAKQTDYKTFDDFAVEIRKKLGTLSRGEALLAGIILSVQLRTQTRIASNMPIEQTDDTGEEITAPYEADYSKVLPGYY
jgi:hypothetical protein